MKVFGQRAYAMRETPSCDQADWVIEPRRFFLSWAFPALALLLSAWLGAAARTRVWAVSLVWMGAACLVNASRCGRRHCYFTGPFFLVMAILVCLHGCQVLGLGPNAWWWLGSATGLGFAGLWYLPERFWGRYAVRDPGK